MIGILLTILKIIGIILLVLLGIVLLLLLLVLFVPVRYRLDAHRDLKEEAPVVAAVKATWLLHLLGVCFTYPDAAYVNVKLFGISVYRSDKEPKPKKEKNTDSGQKESIPAGEIQTTAKEEPEQNVETVVSETKKPADEKKNDGNRQDSEEKEPEQENKTENEREEENQNREEKPTWKQFFLKLLDKIKNIKYTIGQICDKIKHIVKNIRYYLDVIQSETFHRAFSLCSGQLLALLKSIRPRKVKGNLTVGTGDPASTGQILAIHGMLYPWLGNNISITPDFDNQIIEGELLIKGRITVFKALKAALVIFFDKDVKRLIKLFKREVK